MKYLKVNKALKQYLLVLKKVINTVTMLYSFFFLTKKNKCNSLTLDYPHNLSEAKKVKQR